MTLLDFVRLTRAHIRIILAALLVGVALMGLYTLSRPVLYTSTASGQVMAGGSSSTGEAIAGLSLAVSKSQVYASMASGAPVRNGVAEILTKAGKTVPSYSLSASTNLVSPEIVITVTSPSPEGARDAADAGVRALAAFAAANEKASNVNEGLKNVTSVVRIVPLENAALPRTPSSPDWTRNLIVGALLGLALGYVAAIAKRSLDRRIRYVADVEELVGKSVLAVVPQMKSLDRTQDGGLDTSPRGPAAEALRQLRTNLRFVNVDKPPRSVVVTSANPGEGKSTVAANLARLLATSGQRTLLLDADLRRPNVAALFGIDASVGLTQVLAGDVNLDDVILTTPAEPNLHVLPSGRIPPNPSELLGSQKMTQLLHQLEQEYMIVIDAPPLLAVADAGLLSAMADGTLVVIAVGSTYKEQARLLAQRLAQVGGTLLGAVVNKAPMKGIGSVVYGYGYGYSTYSSAYNYYADAGARKKTKDAKPATVRQVRKSARKAEETAPR